MKFLCDRCKTRYSIADERVRGKILKIRCKNCANVISVREGMTDEDPGARPAPERGSGTAAPSAPAAQPARTEGSALQSAFARVMEPAPGDSMAAAPAVLDEEWYVAIDGNQSGPFSLAEAQAWVGGKTSTDELYCWCEGFDDWLPVEKVSHFRGLRQAAPPRKRAPTRRPAPEPAPPAARDEEPKPLFAATLAALEAETARGKDDAKAGAARPERREPAPLPGPRSSGPAPLPGPRSSGPAPLTPLAALPQARPGAQPGSGPTPLSPVGATASAAHAPLPPPRPLSPVSSGPSPAKVPAVPGPSPVARAEGSPAPALAAAAQPEPLPPRPAHPASARFDTGDRDDDAEALDPGALEPMDADDAPGADAGDDLDTDGLDLDIGEVSRVVRLPDLAAMAGRGRASAARAAMRTTGASQAIARGTGEAPAIATGATGRLAATGASGRLAAIAAGGDAELPPLSDGALADARPLLQTPRSRHGHAVMWLISGGVLLVLVVVAAVAASGGHDDGGPISTGGLNNVEALGYTYDDPRRPRSAGDGSGSGTAAPGPTQRVVRRSTGGASGGSSTGGTNPPNAGSGHEEIGPDGEPLLPLTGDDIVNVSSKMSTGTRRCYERALREDPFLKVKKIIVSLKVDTTGVVTDVALDSHTTDKLGLCLVAAIRRWPFRHSTEGIQTQFPLVFEQF